MKNKQVTWNLVKSLMKDWIKNHKFEIVLFFLVFLIHILTNLNYKAIVQSIGNDERVTMVGAATLAGLDWSDIVKKAKYYGIGYTILMAPLFKLTDNPFILYQGMLLYNAVLYAASAVLCFRLMRKLCGKPKETKENLYCLFFSIAAVFVPFKFVFIINEHMLTFLNWLLLTLLVKVAELFSEHKKRESVKYVVVMFLIMMYALVVHTRGLTFWLAVAIVLLVLFLLHHLRIRYWLIGITGAVGGYVLMQRVVKLIQRVIWNNDGSVMLNSTEQLTESSQLKLTYFKHLVNWIFPSTTVLSQVNTMTIATGGLFLFAIIFSIGIIIQLIRKKKCPTGTALLLLVTALFTGLCVFITICGQSVIWMPNAYEITDHAEKMEAIFGKRAKLYIRYFTCYSGPAVMLAGIYVMRFKKTVKTYLLISIGAFAGLSALVISIVGKWYAQFTLVESPVYQLFLPFVFWSEKEYLTREVFWMTALIAFVIFVLWVVLVLFDKRLIMAVLVAGLMLYQYEYLANTCYKDFSDKIYAENYPVYEMLTTVDTAYGLDKTIYVPAGTYSEMALQFYLNRYKFILDTPEGVEIRKKDSNHVPIQKEEEQNLNAFINDAEEGTAQQMENPTPEEEIVEEAIVFVRKKHLEKVKVSSDYKQIRIKGIGKLYIKGENLCDKFEKAGYKLDNR